MGVLDSGRNWVDLPLSWVTMTVSAEQLAKELEIFGLDCDESLTEKCESLAPSPTPAEAHARLARCSQPPRTRRGALPGFTSPRSFSVSEREIKLSFEIWDMGTSKCSQRTAWTPTQK